MVSCSTARRCAPEALGRRARRGARRALRSPDRIAPLRLASGDWALAVAPASPTPSGTELVGHRLARAARHRCSSSSCRATTPCSRSIDGAGRVHRRARASCPAARAVDQLEMNRCTRAAALRETEPARRARDRAPRSASRCFDWNVAIVDAVRDRLRAGVLGGDARVRDRPVHHPRVQLPRLPHHRSRRAPDRASVGGGAPRDAQATPSSRSPRCRSRDEIGAAHAHLQRHDPAAARAARGDRGDQPQPQGPQPPPAAGERGAEPALDHRRPHASCTTTASSRTSSRARSGASSARRSRSRCSLIDIDDFKRLNDRLGHAAGDEILDAHRADILNGAVRGSDLCARYGGEEFVILAPGTDTQGAYLLAEKVRTAIAESVVHRRRLAAADCASPCRSASPRSTGNRKRFFRARPTRRSTAPRPTARTAWSSTTRTTCPRASRSVTA